MSRGTAVQVWDDHLVDTTNADLAFLSTCINHIEFTDDLEPKLYDARRKSLGAIAAAELQELELRESPPRAVCFPCTPPAPRCLATGLVD